MLFYIIIGHRSNKIQSLLDIEYLKLFFFEKKIPLKMGSTNFTPPPPLKWLTPPPEKNLAPMYALDHVHCALDTNENGGPKGQKPARQSARLQIINAGVCIYNEQLKSCN
jgi:hypothetical protein